VDLRSLAAALTTILVASAAPAWADGSGDPAAVKSEADSYFDKNGNPIFKVGSDGTVDWSTYSGLRRYHSECHVCHGPNADGSTFAPALKESVKTLSYLDFTNTVVHGRKNVTSSQENVMPTFADNPNVMCYLDDIFVYVRARANDAVGAGGRSNMRGRAWKEPKLRRAAWGTNRACPPDDSVSLRATTNRHANGSRQAFLLLLEQKVTNWAQWITIHMAA
jgi:methanol metabolism-related c-type cytochrome